MRKEVKSYNFLVVGCAFDGMDKEVLQVLSTFYKHMNCKEVIHLGPVVTEIEKNLARRRLDLLRTIDRSKIKKLKKATNDLETLEYTQNSRIQQLTDAFDGKVLFCAGEEGILPETRPGVELGTDAVFGKSLVLAGVLPAGENVSSNPCTTRAKRYWHRFGKASIIMPHPISVLESFAADGVNKAKIFVTTGCLHATRDIKRHADLKEAQKQPGAIFVCYDDKNDEFHLKRLVFRKIDNKLCVLYDDNVYFSNKVVSVDSLALHGTDPHGKKVHPAAISCLLDAASLLNPGMIVDGGDMGDFESISHWNQKKKKKVSNCDLLQEFKDWKLLLDKLQERCEVILGVDSNHTDEWRWKFLDENPQFESLIGDDGLLIPKNYHKRYLSKHGVPDVLYVGDLAIRHGHQESLQQGYDMYQQYLGGHWHCWNEFGRAVQIGPMCGFAEDYLGGRETRWILMFSTISTYKGKSQVNAKVVLFNEKEQTARYCANGKIYEIKYKDVFKD